MLIWAVTGPVFQYSETWQLIINTGTTIVTFLMVFLIQNTQNRDGAAIQAKLDELIRSGAAKNAFIGIEHLTEAEVEEFRALCARAKENNERAPGSRRKAVAYAWGLGGGVGAGTRLRRRLSGPHLPSPGAMSNALRQPC